jgi:uncharacterized repeat protein (TIGR03943 family)
VSGASAGSGPARLRRSDAATLLAALAGLTLWLSMTDGIYRYLRPTMRPWLLASAVFLACLALATAVVAWRELGRGGPGAVRAGSTRASLVGWLLVVPVVVAVSTDPGALGAFAVRQQGVVAYASVGDFDFETYLRSHTTGGQAPSLQLHQFLAAAQGGEDDRRLLADTPVRLTGFVFDDAFAPPGSLSLARLMIGCCAGDAWSLVVTVRGYDGVPPAEDSWVEVTGNFDEQVTGEQSVPVLVMSSLRHVDEPREPYEYPS